MTIKLCDRLTKIVQVIEKLFEESKKGIPVIVEGKKDADSLRHLGIEGRIITVKTGGKNFFDVISEIELLDVQYVVLLLDFDRRCKEGTKRLVTQLERSHIKANIWFWKTLASLTSRDIQYIESLSNYLETLKNKTNTNTKVCTLPYFYAQQSKNTKQPSTFAAFNFEMLESGVINCLM
jgi:2,5-diamino-6-(ribosylamino)-4(3H)-pyrimidinone 5'-phosphate reductase